MSNSILTIATVALLAVSGIFVVTAATSSTPTATNVSSADQMFAAKYSKPNSRPSDWPISSGQYGYMNGGNTG